MTQLRTKIDLGVTALVYATLDAVAGGHTNPDANSVTWQHTVGVYDDELLEVYVATRSNRSVTGVTFSGAALTHKASVCPGTDIHGELWYMINPAQGAHDVVVSVAAVCTIVGISESHYHVDLTDPYRDCVVSSCPALCGNPTAAVGSEDNDAVVSFVARQSVGNFAAVAPMGEQREEDGTAATASLGTAAGITSIVTCAWTTTAEAWVEICASLRSAPAAAPVWWECPDVLPDPAPSWESGLPGAGLFDMVADTGILAFALDNGESNSWGAFLAYVPGSVSVPGFGEGMPVRARVVSDISTGADLLLNGGFETLGGGGADVFASWNEDTGGAGAVANETVLVHGGAHAAKCTAGAGGGDYASVWESWAVAPSTPYRLRFWTRGDGATAGEFYLFGDASGDLAGGFTGVPGTDYAEVVVDFTTGPADTAVELDLGVSGGAVRTAYFDDATLFAVLSSVRFVGRIAAVRPSSGAYEQPVTEVEAHDWMGFLSTQQAGVLPIATLQRADQAIAATLPTFPVQPFGTPDFSDLGIETFLLVFDTDAHGMSMASLWQKFCRNEMGRIYQAGDGTLTFESRDVRPRTTLGYFSLMSNSDEPMSELDAPYLREDIYNFVQVRIRPATVDAAPTTRLWDLAGAPAIKPGETLHITCEFRDPTTGQPISALAVVDPVAVVEFGSAPDFVSNDMLAFLSQVNVVGGNAIECALTNTHPTRTGYLNDWQVFGKGIYVYDPMTVDDSDPASILLSGERRLPVELEQITDANKAHNYAAWIRGAVGPAHLGGTRIAFVANEHDALADAALFADVSTMVLVYEEATGIGQYLFINRLRYTQDGAQLRVELLCVPASAYRAWVWDASHWDSEEDGRWGL